MSAMLTYTYNLANGGEKSIHTRVRDVLGLGTQSFPLRNPNETPIKPTRNGVTVTISKVDGVYRIESKQEGVQYREITSDGSTTLILLLAGDYVELTEMVKTLEWEFETSGGVRHRFSLTPDNKKSKTGDEAIKAEDAPAPTSAIEEAPKTAEAVDGAPKPTEAPKTTEVPKLKPCPSVVARAQARAAGKEAFQAAAEAALPSLNWGNVRPKTVTFNQAAVDASTSAVRVRGDNRRRLEEMEAVLLGGAPGGSFEQRTQAVNMNGGETQAVNMDGGETQAVNMDGGETQAVVIEDEEDKNYAVLTVTNAPRDVGVCIYSSYVLRDDYSIGRLPVCNMVLCDPNACYSRKAIMVKDNGDAGVTVEIHGTNGVIVKSVDGKATTYPGIVSGSEPKKVQVPFGDEFSIPRGGCDVTEVWNHITFRVTKPM
jgi:hypothetical protein